MAHFQFSPVSLYASANGSSIYTQSVASTDHGSDSLTASCWKVFDDTEKGFKKYLEYLNIFCKYVVLIKFNDAICYEKS